MAPVALAGLQAGWGARGMTGRAGLREQPGLGRLPDKVRVLRQP